MLVKNNPQKQLTSNKSKATSIKQGFQGIWTAGSIIISTSLSQLILYVNTCISHFSLFKTVIIHVQMYLNRNPFFRYTLLICHSFETPRLPCIDISWVIYGISLDIPFILVTQ